VTVGCLEAWECATGIGYYDGFEDARLDIMNGIAHASTKVGCSSCSRERQQPGCTKTLIASAHIGDHEGLLGSLGSGSNGHGQSRSTGSGSGDGGLRGSMGVRHNCGADAMTKLCPKPGASSQLLN
jgi:hypothetical protein